MLVTLKSLNFSLNTSVFQEFKFCSNRVKLGKFVTSINGRVNVRRCLSYGTRDLKCWSRTKADELFSCYKKSSSFGRCFSSDSYFSLSGYDCVGFDLDNTICEYDLNNVVRLEYNIMAEYLVEEKGHDTNALLQPLLASDIDFLQRGLIIDTSRGNLLRTKRDGFIFKACHGSKFLNDEEIEKCYGRDRKWYATTELAQNPVVAWNGPLSEKLRTLADYFDMPAALALSRCVDSKLDGSGPVDCFSIWKDVLSSLLYIYNRKNFSLNSGFFKTDVKTNPGLYYKKCKPEVINWLKELKNRKVTFLITGSNADHASHTAAHCLGDNWRDYFDIVICYARKPGFFVGGRPFIKLNECNEVNSIRDDEIKIGEIYSQGNWQGLHELLIKATKKSNPKCLYVGDNLIQDIFTVAEYTCCDTVAISEELNAEFLEHPYRDFLVSKVWGSYFTVDNNAHSLWGDVIRNYSKICIPNLDVLASKDFDYKFSAFSGNASGYHSLTASLDLNRLSEIKKLSRVLS